MALTPVSPKHYIIIVDMAIHNYIQLQFLPSELEVNNYDNKVYYHCKKLMGYFNPHFVT